jgi:hypothetical protein
MGRQIPIVMTLNDEILFQTQFRNIADFTLIETFAESPEKLFVDSFNEELAYHHKYYLWDKRLKWEPEFAYTITEEKKAYIKKSYSAPFIEFSRGQVFPIPANKAYGRLYVNTYPEENLPYDKAELIKVYNAIVKIIKKTSEGKFKYHNWVTYFYPESWEKYQKTITKT